MIVSAPEFKPYQPMVDDGERLATIERGPNVELRFTLKKFKGHRFIRLQQWEADPHNSQWWPSKGKGFSIKARELDAIGADLIEAMERGQARAERHECV